MLLRIMVLAFLALPLVTLAACSASKPSDRDLVTADPVLEPEALAAEIANVRDLRILDVRKAEDYAKGHVAGAVNISLDDWSAAARAEGGRESQADWNARLGALGISADTRVLIYDGGSMTPAASTWFLLQHYGVRRAAIVNGGWKVIETVQPQLIASTPAPAIKAVRFTPASDRPPVLWADKDEVKAIIAKDSARIWDSRSADEYTGKMTRDNPRVGHLPKAVNLAHRSLMDEQGRVRSREELRAMLTAAGFKPGDRIVAHCQSGGRSSLAALAAVRAGFGPLENYYMSFGEWAKDESCPIIKPQG